MSTGPHGFCASRRTNPRDGQSVSSKHGGVPKISQSPGCPLWREFSCHSANRACKALCSEASPMSACHWWGPASSCAPRCHEWPRATKVCMPLRHRYVGWLVGPVNASWLWGATLDDGWGPGDRGFVGEGCNRKSVIVFGWPRSTRPPTAPISKTSHPHRALCLVPPHLPPHHTISPPCHRQCPSPSSPHVAHPSPLSWRRFERQACHPCLRCVTLLSQALQLTRTQERLLGDQEQ